MKNSDGSYRYDWRALFQMHPHGAKGRTPLTKDDLTQNANGSLQPQNNAEGGSGCPVKHEQTSGEGGGCPVKEYNVYSQPIDSTNQMPSNPNQLPAPGQQKAISTNRISSSIAKVRRPFHLFLLYFGVERIMDFKAIMRAHESPMILLKNMAFALLYVFRVALLKGLHGRIHRHRCSTMLWHEKVS